jgi:RNA polymerase sigma factor (sigma-70 family)
MEVSALRYSGASGRHGRSPLLKLQSDERLVAMVRRGNQGAFEVLVARYNARLLSFCRHMLGSREDAEDVLQDVLTASYNALLADERPINVRPWLYRIARNRCLNHLRRNRTIGVDSMDIHFSDNGASTADKVHDREEFRQLLHDIRDLPETQRTALVLREMDALSYEQIAEAMETTVSSVKSLLVRARVSLTEAAEARLLSCDEVREELAEIAEGLRRKQSASVRRHVKNCPRCELFQGEMRKSSRALAALTPVGPLAFFHKTIFHKLLFTHAAHSAGSAGAGVAGAAGAGGAGAGAAGAAGGAGSAGLVTAGVGAVATKAAAGIAAAALVTAGTVAIDHSHHAKHVGPSASALISRSISSGLDSAIGAGTSLGGAVGAGPGLSASVVPAAARKPVHRNGPQAPVTAATAPAKHSAATNNAASKTNAAVRIHETTLPQSPSVISPPASTPQTMSTSTLSPTGGVGLATTPAADTTNSTSSTALSSTPPVTSTVSAGTTTTSTPVADSTTDTTTTPTGTTTGTSTSTTATTSTTTTMTSTTGTTTQPDGTTTATVTDTNPADTSTGTPSNTTPVQP